MEIERNFEVEAARQGWKPKDQFAGDESQWVDAKTFVERGEASAGILKSKVEKLERRIANAESVNKSLTEHHNRMLEKEAARRKELIEQLEEVRAQAVSQGDSQAFKNADRQLNDLREAQKNEEILKANQTGVDPEIEGWLEENKWYSEDYALQVLADGFADKLRKTNPNLKGRAFLDKVSEFVEANAPTKKTSPRKSQVDSETDKVTTRENKQVGSRSFADLPADAQKECLRLVKQIKGFTKEQYCQYYDWE